MNKLLVLLMLVGMTTMAQEKAGSHHRSRMHDMTPEQMATLQTKKMTLALDLSKAQQDQMHSLNLDNAKARKAKIAERKASKENGEHKKPSSEERYAMANARLDAQLAQKEEMKKILSDEQMEKWEKMRQGKRKHRGRKGKEKKGGREK